ncbi:MAG TPA: tetratricopeptide repeat protein [Gammaproteobacteria bacterium]
MNRHTLILSLLLATAGCATQPLIGTAPRPAPAPREPAPDDSEAARAPGAPRDPGFPSPDAETRRAPAPPTSAEPPPQAAPASVALLEQSRSQRAAGSLTAAASSIERALRIDPNNAELWLELGEIKLEDGDPLQAEQMARKALTLAGGDRVVAARAARLLARAASCASGGC